jgi:prevent-host-death family protein
MRWQIQQAKARFSEMVERTRTEGPQTVTRHGRTVAVLVPAEEFPRLRGRGKGFKEMLAEAPLQGIDISRSR